MDYSSRLQTTTQNTKDCEVNKIKIEQFADSIIEYTSRYNKICSVLYSPDNLIGKPTRFPNGGDDPFTYMLRSYGPWWHEIQSAQTHYMPNDQENVPVEDFLTMRFKYPVIPSAISIYETLNPGAIVQIWARLTGQKWYLMYKGNPDKCREMSRHFKPKINEHNILVNEVRLEFNQCKLNYHTSLDAVLLIGYRIKSPLVMNVLEKCGEVILRRPSKTQPAIQKEEESLGISYLLNLPNEVITHIFSYLNLTSLNHCAQVNKRFYELTKNAWLYRNLSLKRYWPYIDNSILAQIAVRCKNIKKLDLSWCGQSAEPITTQYFEEFLFQSCRKLTHLALNHCKFLKGTCLKSISEINSLTELRLKGCNVESTAYLELVTLKNLCTLDVSLTQITFDELAPILQANRHLKHLIIDFCENVVRVDDLTTIVATYNSELRTWSSWQVPGITSVGIEVLSNCRRLRDVDIGWAMVQNEPASCLSVLAANCSDLRRLILAGWRAMSNHNLLPIVRACKYMSQLNLTGIKNITSDIVDIILKGMPRLRMLDISFCDGIKSEQVVRWRKLYSQVVIHRSCEVYTVASDDDEY